MTISVLSQRKLKLGNLILLFSREFFNFNDVSNMEDYW